MKTRDEIKANIAQLMVMGNDPRTNEFEAEAALRLAAKLMAKHAIEQMEIADATGEKTRYDWTEVCIPANPKSPTTTALTWFSQLSLGVCRFTDTRGSWVRLPVHGMCIKFQGDATDVQYAAYLAKHLRDTVRRDSAKFAGSRTEREYFRRAMVGRIIDRMRDIKAEQQRDMQDAPSGGRALVLVSNKIAERDARFGKMKTRNVSHCGGNEYSTSAGRAAGDRVGFGRPVGQDQRAAITQVATA